MSEDFTQGEMTRRRQQFRTCRDQRHSNRHPNRTVNHSVTDQIEVARRSAVLVFTHRRSWCLKICFMKRQKSVVWHRSDSAWAGMSFPTWRSGALLRTILTFPASWFPSSASCDNQTKLVLTFFTLPAHTNYIPWRKGDDKGSNRR